MSEIDKDLELADEWAKSLPEWCNDGWRATCKRLANEVRLLRAELSALRRQEPVCVQHRVPNLDVAGRCVGYSAWRVGEGFPGWPHRKLYAAPVAQPAVCVPEGWKLVPVEPTEEMLASAWRTDVLGIAGTYKAMLAAAPEAKP